MTCFLNTDAAAKRALPRAPFCAPLTAVVMPAASVGVSQARPHVGGAPLVFLMIEPDSRSAGMGNTGVAIADNAYSIFWNPAGLAFQEGIEASLTHSNWLPEFDAGLYYEYLVGKYHVPGWGTFGAHVTFLNLGEHEGRDAQNNPTTTFRSYDLAAGASYGFKVNERFALGTAMRFIYSNLAPGQTVGLQETRAGVSVGIDVAGLYRTAPFSLGGVNTTFSAGFNLANMGPTIQYSDSPQADPIPTNLRFGYAFDFKFDEYNKITFANDFVKMLTHSVENEATGLFEPDPFYKAIFTAWSPIEVRTNATSEEDAELTQLGVLEQLIIG